ncbi:MAG TPA: hypothetical protein VK162_17490 [Streptosporangiaceae bacterium]|nr:hypothetical protein [Streptosporangiaceae bacterium]
MSAARSVSAEVEVAVDAPTAFGAFTEEMNLWWVRGPINFFDSARAVAVTCEPGVGGRLLEVSSRPVPRLDDHAFHDHGNYGGSQRLSHNS